MVQECGQTKPEEDATESDQGDDTGSNQGCSRYSRMGKDSSVASWLASKEEKRTKAASKGLSRGTGFSKGSRLNPVSKKRKKKNVDYKEASESHYSEEKNQRCFLCGKIDNLSIHHKKKRGKYLDDEFYFVTLCIAGSQFMNEKYPDSNPADSCHQWVEANKGLAREMKLIL